MINAKTYNELISNLISKTGCSQDELENMLCVSIAKVYGGVNSALIWEDGSVSIAFVKEGVVEIKDYIVSKKHFTKILLTMNSLIKERIIKTDINNYLVDSKEKVYEIEKISIEKFEYKVELTDEFKKGFLRDYNFYMTKDDLFFNDAKRIKNNEIEMFFVTVFNLSDEKKRVLCGRFNKTIAKHIFDLEFKRINDVLDTKYSYGKAVITLDKKQKKVNYFIEFRNKPSGVFVSELSKRLNKNLGNVEIYFDK